MWPGTATGLRVAVAFSDLKESELGILFRADLVLPQKGGASERRSWSNLLTYKVYKVYKTHKVPKREAPLTHKATKSVIKEELV